MSTEEEATAIVGGESKKASRVGKEEEEKVICLLCCSNSPKPHESFCCPWNVRIPLGYVPKVDANWMVICKNCEKERPYADNKACACSCGYNGKYVCLKRCCACLNVGHKNKEDTACKYYGKTGEDDPFNKIVKSLLEKVTLNPENPFGFVEC